MMRDLYKILNNTPYSVTQILFSVRPAKSQIQLFVYKINIFLTKGQPIKCIVPTTFIMSTPLGGGYIIFAFFAVRCPMSVVRCPMSGVRCPASRMVSAHLKEKY